MIVMDYLRGRYGRGWQALHHPVANPELRRSLLARYLCYVEVEVFSFCNRRCVFCPNATIDRQSTNTHLSEDIYRNLLRQLAHLGFVGRLSFSRYNEPLADHIIIERIAQANQALPRIRLHTNTNGDYLDKEYLTELRRAGLSSISIQDYSQDGGAVDVASAIQRFTAKVSDLGLDPANGRFQLSPGEVAFIYGQPDFRLEIRSRNFGVLGNSRGNLVSGVAAKPRRAPCFEAHNGIYIDYNGNVMPCCNLRSDADEHRPFLLGNIATDPIEAIFFSDAAIRLRKDLGGRSTPPSLCATCNFRNYLVAPSQIQLQTTGQGHVVPFYSIPTILLYCRDRITEKKTLLRPHANGVPL